MVQAMNLSSADYQQEVNEFTKAGLKTSIVYTSR